MSVSSVDLARFDAKKGEGAACLGIMDDVTRRIDAACRTVCERINNIECLVVRDPTNPVLRQYFQSGVLVSAYRDSEGNWYSAPNLIHADGPLCIYRMTIEGSRACSNYTPFRDFGDRKFILISANWGVVPVRHGTDPKLKNWLSRESPTHIVCDEHLVRHPAFEGINYKAHGFNLVDQKTWWPLFNGLFKRSFERIRTPYDSDNGPESKTEELLQLLDRQDSLDFADELIHLMDRNAPFEEIRALLNDNPKIWLTQEQRGRAVREAARLGKTAELALLLKGSILSEDHSTALIQAVERGNIPSVQVLLSNEAHLPIEKIGEAAILAAKLGFSQILTFILQKRMILPQHRAQALLECVQRASFVDVGRLLNGPISVAGRGLAVVAACTQDFTLFREILDKGPILLEDRGMAVIASVDAGSFDHMRRLLMSREKISMKHRGTAAISAAKIGRLDVVEELENDGSISPLDQLEIKQIASQFPI